METLRKEVVEVTFLKLDGDERKMPCTLITSFLPPAKKDDPMSQKKVREVSDKVCAVWAIEAKGFRSFRYDRVTKVEVVTRLQMASEEGDKLLKHNTLIVCRIRCTICNKCKCRDSARSLQNNN